MKSALPVSPENANADARKALRAAPDLIEDPVESGQAIEKLHAELRELWLNAYPDDATEAETANRKKHDALRAKDAQAKTTAPKAK